MTAEINISSREAQKHFQELHWDLCDIMLEGRWLDNEAALLRFPAENHLFSSFSPLLFDICACDAVCVFVNLLLIKVTQLVDSDLEKRFHRDIHGITRWTQTICVSLNYCHTHTNCVLFCEGIKLKNIPWTFGNHLTVLLCLFVLFLSFLSLHLFNLPLRWIGYCRCALS